MSAPTINPSDAREESQALGVSLSIAPRDAPAKDESSVLEQIVAARAELASSSLDSLIAVRAWCDAVAEAAKQKALAEVALEAGETRARAEYQLGRLLRQGAGSSLRIKSRDALIGLAELTGEQFEATLKEMRRRRSGDQILQFRPTTVLHRAVSLFSEEVEPGIKRDFRGLYNGFATLKEARSNERENRMRDLRWQRFNEKWSLRAERQKPEHVRLDTALTRTRRLAQAVSSMSSYDFCGLPAREHLGRAELLLAEAAEALHLALQSAVLGEESSL